ncbi:MAG TPA: hypothetical protein VGN01_08195, partial [Acidobacteriaceae bacterium]
MGRSTVTDVTHFRWLWSGGGVDCGEDDGFGRSRVRLGLGWLRGLAQDDGLWGSGFSGRGFGWGCLFGRYFGDGGQVSEEGVGDDFLDERVGLSGGGFLWLGEVGGGDLEAVEEHACALEVD